MDDPKNISSNTSVEGESLPSTPKTIEIKEEKGSLLSEEKKDDTSEKLEPALPLVESPKSSAVKTVSLKEDEIFSDPRMNFKKLNKISSDEIDFYLRLFASASQVKTLSWRLLEKTLTGFGWSKFEITGGSSVKFQAPQWYQDRVGKKFGSSFSVHRAHKPNAKPMPFYVFKFLHSGLSKIGLDPVTLTQWKSAIAD